MGDENRIDSTNAKDPMAGCSIRFPEIDEAKLLAEVRSPSFLIACRKLRIDPLELRPKSFDSFKSKDTSFETQQIRFAMYQRSRYQKWKAINECSFVETDAKGTGRSASRTALSNTWIGSEISRTGPMIQRGKSEVFLCCLKSLKETANQGTLSRLGMGSYEENHGKRKGDIRKDYLKKITAESARRKEFSEKIKASQIEREQAIMARDQALEQRRALLLERWKQELKKKKEIEQQHQRTIQNRISQLSNSEGIGHGSQDQSANISAVESSRPFSSPTVQQFKPLLRRTTPGTADPTARWRHERMAQRAAEQNKQLILEFKRQQQDFERKISEREERHKELAKTRKAKENEMRKKITFIRKHAKEILTERIEGTLEHLMKADNKLAALRVRTKKSIEMKAEMDRLRFEQARERIDRLKATRQSRLLELEQIHQKMDRDKEERERTIQELLSERQAIATQIRLQKMKVQEDILQIHQTKSWNRAHQLMQDLKPTYTLSPYDTATLPASVTVP